MTYKVELDVFNGPVDLLLYLIRREEVDIRDIAIARIADQYVAYLDVLKGLDIELAGDFVVMAATLIELKSRALLPRPPEAEDEDLEAEEDPRETLIQQLIEYRRYKEAAGVLSDRGRDMARRFPRLVDERRLKDLQTETDDEEDLAAPDLLEGVEVWDLFTAFSEIVKTLGYAKPREVVYDETPVEEAAQELLARLKAERSVLFTQLFEPGHTLGHLITLFLATLELMRKREIGVEQAADFKDIRIYLRDPETETYTARKPKGAAAYKEGLKRKRPRRPTVRQRERIQEMFDESEIEKTEFDDILESVEVPDVEPFRPIYSEGELMGRAEDAEAADRDSGAAQDAATAPAEPAEAPDADDDPDAPPEPEP